MSTARILKVTNEGQVQFFENSANGTNKVAVKAPASLAADRTITLPGAAPTDTFFVQTNGSGVWAYAAGTATLQTAYDAATPTITIGGGGAVRLDLAAGGDMLRLTAGATDFELGAAAAGAAYLGTVGAHGLDLKTNNVNRISVLSTGEVGVSVTPEAGVALKVGGTILIPNGSFFRGEKADGSNSILLGVDGSDILSVGDDVTAIKLSTGSLQALRVDSSQRIAIGQLGAITAKLHVEQSGNVVAARFFKTGTGGGNAVEVEDDGTGTALAVVKDGVGTALTIAQNSTGSAVIITSQGGIDITCSTTDTDTHIFGVFQGANGQDRRQLQKTISHSVTASNPNTLSSFIPAGANVLGLTARVTTTITGTATSMDIGVSGALDRYGDNRGLTGGTTTDSYTHGTITTGALIYAATTDLLLTPVGGTFDAVGVIRITLHYEMLTAPTS